MAASFKLLGVLPTNAHRQIKALTSGTLGEGHGWAVLQYCLPLELSSPDKGCLQAALAFELHDVKDQTVV